MTQADALVVSHLSKRFAAVRALDDVSLAVAPGEIRALVGENGAGKSTLVKILSGYHAPDTGEIRLWGDEVRLPISRPASHGIAIVHQDLALAEELTVWENIGVGTGFDTRALAPISKRREKKVVGRLIERFDQTFGPDDMVSTLARPERSVVAILRAIREIEKRERQESVLVLDEPTSLIFGEEVERLLSFIRAVAQEGSTVILIDHHLQHVLDVADSVTVLRSGRVVGTHEVGTLSIHSLVRLMLGYDVDKLLAGIKSDASKLTSTAALGVDDLCGEVVDHLSFDVAPGEIVGITGLPGMGHEEVPYLVSGAVPRRAGVIRMAGRELGATLADSLREKLALVPNRTDAIWLDASASENLTLAVLDDLGGALRMVRSRQLGRARALMEEFNVEPRDPSLPMSAFSGGNQQKLLLAKWLQIKPRALVLDSPTRGVDAGGRVAVLQLLRATAANGCAVVIGSEDAEELGQVCDRVMVLKDGRLIASLEGADKTVQNILATRERKSQVV